MDDFQQTLNLVGTGFIYWAAIVGVLSVVVHLRVFDRHSAMSVHLLCYMTAIAAVLVLSAIRNLTGDSWWIQLLRLFVFMLVPIFMSQRLYLQIKAQRQPRNTRPPLPAPKREQDKDPA